MTTENNLPSTDKDFLISYGPDSKILDERIAILEARNTYLEEELQHLEKRIRTSDLKINQLRLIIRNFNESLLASKLLQ